MVEGVQLSQTLKKISLKNTNIGNTGVRIFAEGITGNRTLEEIDISSNAVTIEGFIPICEALSTNNISSFKSRNNLLGDDSMKYFSSEILSPNSTSKITKFDFSQSKINDQGLIYLLNDLRGNTKIKRVKLRDNYFTHEIDYVILDLIEQNTSLLHLDLSKNRLSLQCLRRVNEIIDRNNKIFSDKEPNKLLVEVYRLKYENTKLDEMKESLKFLEGNVEKLRLSRADIRSEFENFKRGCDEEVDEYRKKTMQLKVADDRTLDMLKEAQEHSDSLRKEYSARKENLERKLKILIEKKEELEKGIDEAKSALASSEKSFVEKFEDLRAKCLVNKEKTKDLEAEFKPMMEEIRELDREIAVYKKTK